MFAEDQLLPLSALQHVQFCERQFALIHIEQAWAENRLTVEGRQMHEKVHGGGAESRGAVRIARAVRLRSLALGLTGVADVVEFCRQPDGSWRPFPVEYKRGRPKQDGCDLVQLCAQALCLEEMLGASVPEGALFYGTTRRRLDVAFDEALRTRTAATAARAHELFARGVTPAAAYEPKCDNCSLLDLCLPRLTGARKSASAYLQQMVTE